MSACVNGNTHMIVTTEENAPDIMLQQQPINLPEVSDHATILAVSSMESVEEDITYSQPQPYMFTEVTAKVPMFLLERLGLTEHLPFLVRLAKDVNVSILVGVEDELETELKSFSFFGTLSSIIMIQHRIDQLFQTADNSDQSQERQKYSLFTSGIFKDQVDKVTVGVNTDNLSSPTKGRDKGVLCRLLEEPRYTRSGRKVRTPILHSLYDCEEEENISGNQSEGERSDLDKSRKVTEIYNQSPGENSDLDTTWRNTDSEKRDIIVPHPGINDVISNTETKDDHHSSIVRTGNRKRGRPRKIKAPDNSSYKDSADEKVVDNNQQNDKSPRSNGVSVKQEGKEGDTEDIKQDQVNEGEMKTLMNSDEKLPSTGRCNLEDLIKIEKNPVQRARLQKLLYEERTPNKFSCKYCSFTTKRQSHLEKHQQVHEKKGCKVLKCPTCDFKTIRKGRLLVHQDQCKHNTVQSDNEKTAIVPHWRESHKNFKKLVTFSKKKELRCHLCDYTTDKPKMLNRHMAVHKEAGDHLTELFRCTEEGCEYSTRSKGNFQFHMKGKHSTLKPFLCDTCGTKFKGDRYGKELQACVEIPDEKYWVCDISLEFFTTDIYMASVEMRKNSLKTHLKFVHVENNKKPLPFQCNICSKRFRSKAHLLEHSVKHTNIRQHLCSICGVAFKTKSAAKRHMHTVHSSSVVRPVCEHCLKPFNSKYTLQRHLQAAEGKCSQADRLRNKNVLEEGANYELTDATVTMDLLKSSHFDQDGGATTRHSIVVQKDQVLNIVPMEEGYVSEQVFTVEIPAVGQDHVLGEDVTLMQGSNNLVVLPTDGMVVHQQDVSTAAGTVNELPGQQGLLGNETLQGLLSGQLFNVNTGDSQTQLMYISNT